MLVIQTQTADLRICGNALHFCVSGFYSLNPPTVTQEGLDCGLSQLFEWQTRLVAENLFRGSRTLVTGGKLAEEFNIQFSLQFEAQMIKFLSTYTDKMRCAPRVKAKSRVCGSVVGTVWISNDRPWSAHRSGWTLTSSQILHFFEK